MSLRLPEFLDNRQLKLASLSALSAGPLYPQEMSLVLVSDGVDPRATRIKAMENLSFLIGNRTRPASCSNWKRTCLLRVPYRTKSVAFTKYHTNNKCTNCMSFILNHFFKTHFTAPTCFDSISLIIIREHI